MWPKTHKRDFHFSSCHLQRKKYIIFQEIMTNNREKRGESEREKERAENEEKRERQRE